MKTLRNCLECKKIFKAFTFMVKKGHGNYCSYSCSSKATSRKLFKSEQERFLLKISNETNENNCWIWNAAKDKDGYGIFTSSYGKLHRSTRYVWELFNNCKIQKKMIVCHKCDNPKCVNPDHLFVGTYKDNAVDRELKGRSKYQKGSKSPLAKLNEKQVSLIKKKLREKVCDHALAERFNVSIGAIRNIKYNNTWRHVT